MTPPRGARPPQHSIVLHGHFYQPPRENPWTEQIPEQPTAAPFHDWNERIERECYGPIVESRVLGTGGAPDQAVNTLEWMSFNFGPTLLWWMERYAPATYSAVLEADRRSLERLGHGNALAMPYHHPILPLSSERDRTTEIRWGIEDFRHRFGRAPEGMWLPETAVDAATLDALAEQGILFTILAPHQVDPVPADGRPVRYTTASGRDIALFVYDGALSHGVAFGDLLKDGVAWAELMAAADPAPALRSLATDGETFGHHHKFAEMALAKAIVELRSRPRIRVENFAAFLAREGASAEATLVEPSAWSCAHGVGRWQSDCGCKADTSKRSNQAWRGPLRSALVWLAEGLHDAYERDGGPLLGDVWAARDAFGAVVGSADSGAREAFVQSWMAGEPASEKSGKGAGGQGGEKSGGDAGGQASAHGIDDQAIDGQRPVDHALRLLTMEQDALRLFTSCAWFFDDVGGLEPRQVLQYAAHGLEMAGEDGDRLREGFVSRLTKAKSNDPKIGSAARVFEEVSKLRESQPQATTAPLEAGAS